MVKRGEGFFLEYNLYAKIFIRRRAFLKSAVGDWFYRALSLCYSPVSVAFRGSTVAGLKEIEGYLLGSMYAWRVSYPLNFYVRTFWFIEPGRVSGICVCMRIYVDMLKNGEGARQEL